MAKTKSTSKRIHAGANTHDAAELHTMPSAARGIKKKQIRSEQKSKSTVIEPPRSVPENPDFPLDEEWRRAFEACYNKNFSDPRLLIEMLNRYLPEEVHPHIEDLLFKYVAPAHHRHKLPRYKINELHSKKLLAVSIVKLLRKQKMPLDEAISETENALRMLKHDVDRAHKGKDSSFEDWKKTQKFFPLLKKA